MHSDLDQAAREDAINGFRSGRIDILIATDILARGIDIDDISMVVNYDVPREAEDYVHRIGRTARANADGKAVTFVAGKDQSKFKYIEDFLGYEVRKEAVPAELGEAPEYNPRSRGSRNGKSRFSRSGVKRNNRGNGGARDKKRTPSASSPSENPSQLKSDTPAKNRKPRRYHHRGKKGGSGTDISKKES